MSWDDVVIGEGNKQCSACHVFAIEGDHNISENDVSYWIHRLTFIDIGATIFKSTDEGQQLQKLIRDGASLVYIEKELFKMIMLNIEPSKMLKAIQRTNETAYKEGRADLQRELRKLIGA